MFKLQNFKKIIAISILALSISAQAKMEYPDATNLDSVSFLNASELKELYSNKTMSGKNLKFKKKIEIFYNENGTYKGTVASGKKKVSGKWFVKDNGSICFKKKMRTNCKKVYKDGDHYIIIKNNKMTSKVQFK